MIQLPVNANDGVIQRHCAHLMLSIVLVQVVHDDDSFLHLLTVKLQLDLVGE